jgi:DNA-binding XRE family transcriptional regulator
MTIPDIDSVAAPSVTADQEITDQNRTAPLVATAIPAEGAAEDAAKNTLWAEATPNVAPRRRGRPPGSKNRAATRRGRRRGRATDRVAKRRPGRPRLSVNQPRLWRERPAARRARLETKRRKHLAARHPLVDVEIIDAYIGANRIKELLARKQLTQEELSRRSFTSYRQVNRLTMGQTNPSLLAAYRIAAVLAEPVDEIFHIAIKTRKARAA